MPQKKNKLRNFKRKKTVKKKPVRIVRKPKTIKDKKIKRCAKKEKIAGIITHYFPKIGVGVVKMKNSLAIGDNIKIKGHTTDFTQTVTSMQINHVPIQKAKKNQEIGLLVNYRVRKKDTVYKI